MSSSGRLVSAAAPARRPQRYFCDHAWLGGVAAAANVLVSTAGERVAAVDTGADRPADAVHLRGLTVPGFANAHSHAFHRALRGRTQAGRGTFWTWREEMYRTAQALTPESYYRLARATYAEMALAGVTAVGEFHYVHHDARGAPYADANAMGRALLAAARDAGLRITLLDACYLESAPGRPPVGAQVRFADASAQSWAERVEQLAGLEAGAGARLGAAVHSLRAVPPRGAELVAQFSRAHGLAAALSPVGTSGGERGRPARLWSFSHRAARDGGSPDAGFDRRPRHPSVRPRRGPAGGFGDRYLYVPDHRTGSGRRHRAGAPAGRGRRAGLPGLRQPRRDRPVPGNAQPRVRRTLGHRCPRPLGRPRTFGRRHRLGPRWPSGGRRRGAYPWAHWPTWSP